MQSNTNNNASTTATNNTPDSQEIMLDSSTSTATADNTPKSLHIMQSSTNNTLLRRIGQGFCATVWALPEGSHIIKRDDGGPRQTLENDYLMHRKILLSLKLSRICISGCHQYIPNTDLSYWTPQLPLYPAGFRPCNALITDRIPPFPKEVREKFIDLFCEEPLQSIIKASDPDQDCLIRPYLGRRRVWGSDMSQFNAFSLRNYPLHICQIEQLGLDGVLYAQIMAETLAELYWRARVDANDIEFVLAPPPSSPSPHGSETSMQGKASDSIIKSEVLGDHTLWILDFDCCKPMSMDAEGVAKAVSCFWRNDHYYPLPGMNEPPDRLLWTEFKKRFLAVSQGFLRGGSRWEKLPQLWVDMAEERAGPTKPQQPPPSRQKGDFF